MTETRPPAPPLEVRLGVTAIVAVHLAPVLTLTPEKKKFTIEQLETTSVPIEGTCVNLVEPVHCTVSWLMKTDALGEEQRTFEQPGCMLVPNGKTFKVVKEGQQTLPLSAWDLGLLGTGKLGYVIRPTLFGSDPVTVSPEESGLSVKLPLKVHSSVSAPLVGTRTRLSLECATALEPYVVSLRVCEAPGGPKAKSDVDFTWEPADLAAHKHIDWLVGRAAHDGVVDGGLPHFSYDPNGTSGHPYVAHLVLSEPPAPGPRGGKAKPRIIDLPPAPLFQVPHPRLEDFRLEAWGTKLMVEGEFSGFDPSLAVPLEVELFADGSSLGGPRPLWDLVNDPWLGHAIDEKRSRPMPSKPSVANFSSGAAPRRSVEVKQGAFSAEVFDLGTLGARIIEGLTELGVQCFATISFPSGTADGDGAHRPLFYSVAGYEPAMAQGHPGGKAFAPFRGGVFSWQTLATSVCSNLNDLRGHDHELRAPMPGVSPGQQKEFEVFVATVAGESLGSSPKAWVGVAHTIMNRVGRYEWAKFNTPLAVIANTGFDAYTKRETSDTYQCAMKYFAGQPIAHPADRDALLNLIPLVTPIYLRTAIDPTDVTFFFNPQTRAIRDVAPNEAQVVEITNEVLGTPRDGRDQGRWTFLRYVARAKPFSPS